MTRTPLRVWESSTTLSSTFPFSVSDAHAGSSPGSVQRREVGSRVMAVRQPRGVRGSKNPEVIGVEGTRFDYRVVARTSRGTRRSGSARVYIPRDDDSLGLAKAGSRSPRRPCPRPIAFGAPIRRWPDRRLHLYLDADPRDCLFELIGPRTGTWTVDVTANDVDQTRHHIRRNGRSRARCSSPRRLRHDVQYSP